MVAHRRQCFTRDRRPATHAQPRDAIAVTKRSSDSLHAKPAECEGQERFGDLRCLCNRAALVVMRSQLAMATAAIVFPHLQRLRRRRGSILSYSWHWHLLCYSSALSFIGYSSIRKLSGRQRPNHSHKRTAGPSTTKFSVTQLCHSASMLAPGVGVGSATGFSYTSTSPRPILSIPRPYNSAV